MNRKIFAFLPVVFIIISCTNPPRVEEGFIEVGDTSLYYKAIGSGEPIVVLHGGPGFDHQILMPYIGKLGRRHKVIQYDQRGSGLSKGPINETSINIDSFIQDIESIRRHFRIEKLNLAGVSWGGVLALFYGIEYPENLNSLILFSTAASSELLNKMYPAMRKRTTPEDAELMKTLSGSEEFKRKNPETLEKYFRLFCKAQFVDPPLAARINLTLCENTANNLTTVSNLVWASIGNFDLHDSLGSISCPALVMHGRGDPLPLEAAENIHARLPDSELVLFEKSGHWMFIEEEEKFLKTVNEFLSRVESKSLPE